MQSQHRYPQPIWGLVAGALLTPALMAVMYLGERFADLPFLPFDLFNWITRILPGDLITFGIDTMVNLLIMLGLGNDLDAAAKFAEQLMALGMVFLLGTLLGLVYFAIMRMLKPDTIDHTPGVLFGIASGFVLMLISLNVNVSSTAPQALQVIWHLLLLVGFGAALSWSFFELVEMQHTESVSDSDSASAHKINRREFIVRVGGASATLTVVGAGLGALLNTSTPAQSTVSSGEGEETALRDTSSSDEPLPNADAAVQPAPGTRPEVTPVEDHYRIDILSGGLPAIPDDYTLPITGLVGTSVAWTLDEIRDMPSMSEYITMSCISNRIGGSLISTTKWTGVSFQHILEQLQPTEDAVALKVTGYDDFDEYIELDLIRNDERIMLAYAFDDQPLPLRNGYPLRVHIPDRYGMKQPKWIRSIEVVDEWEPGYWVRRGWSRDAIVNATSVIDTVATRDIYSDETGALRVPVGGIAWAGDRPITAVEVRVDGGDWEAAELREPLSQRSWTIWRYDWPFSEGRHEFEVRAYEAAPDSQSDPILQLTDPRGVRPDGATGIHSVTQTVQASEQS